MKYLNSSLYTFMTKHPTSCMLSQQFERYTTQYIQQYSNCVPQSKMQLNEMILACTKQQKRRIWSCIGKQMEMTAIQVHDYFYNTW